MGYVAFLELNFVKKLGKKYKNYLITFFESFNNLINIETLI